MVHTLADIYTTRLRLVPMSPAFLRAVIAGESGRASAIAGFAVPPEILIPKHVLEFRLAAMEKDPSLEPWLLRSIVHVETATMVGNIGFHDAPGAQYLREYCDFGAEAGYAVFSDYRGQGYAGEALRALLAWAAERHGVHTFVLSIDPANIPSMRLAASLGFERVGAHLDDADGPEDIFLLDLLPDR